MVGLHGSPLRKPYSVASAPLESTRSGLLELLLQIDDGGALDPHLDRAESGTMLDVEGPFGRFGPADAMSPAPLLLVAGGTGIAPLRSILVEHLSVEPASPVALIYSARTPAELAYYDEFDGLHRAGRLRAFFTVTRDAGAEWTGRRGRINAALLGSAWPGGDARCLACGPPELVEDVRVWLTGTGVPGDRFLSQLT
jgi:ferredoxin-NADP reductase